MKIDLLAFAAHPDDVEQTCGGTLLRMADQGYRTGVLDLTAGDMGTRGDPETRVAESEAAGKHMLLKFPTGRPATPITTAPPNSASKPASSPASRSSTNTPNRTVPSRSCTPASTPT